MRRNGRSRRLVVLAIGAVVLAAVALVPRIPAIAGYRYLGVIEAAPVTAPFGIDPALTISRSAAETDAIWAGMTATLWDSPAPFDGPPTLDYEWEILALATLFASSSCEPSFDGVDMRDGAATIRVDHSRGFGGCTADAVPYTFLVGIARDRLSGDPPEIHMLPTPRPIAVVPSATPRSSDPPEGSNEPPGPSGFPPPSFDPAWVTRPALWCGGGLQFPPEAITHALAGAENWIDGAAAELRRIVRAESTPEMPFPSSGWYRVADTGDQVLFVARGNPDVPWIQVGLAFGAGWRATSYGECRLAVTYPGGITGATMRLDPAFPRPTAQSRDVHVLISETACASGQSPKGRVLDPLVVYGPASVVVAIAVRHRPGGQDCPGNPEFPVTIVLTEPLGDRALLDGGRFPPQPVVP